MRVSLAFYQTAALQHIAIKCELQRAHQPITVLHDSLPNRSRDQMQLRFRGCVLSAVRWKAFLSTVRGWDDIN